MIRRISALLMFTLFGCGTAPQPEIWRECSRCEATMTDSVTLGASAGVNGPAWKLGTSLRPAVAIDSRNQYYLSPTYTPGSVSIFSAAGELIHTVGTPGSGPGELLEATRPTIGPGDSLFVWDAEQGRMVHYSPDYTFVRSYRFPVIVDQFIAQEHRLLVRPRARESVARPPIMVFRSPHGELLEEQGQPSASATILAARGDSIFVALGSEISITVYTSVGSTTITRAPEWLPRTREARAHFRVRDMQVDSSGLVWLLMSYPNPRFERSNPLEAGVEGPMLSASDAARRMIYVVEALDLDERKVVAQRPLMGEVLWTQLVDGPRLVGLREGKDGIAVVNAWKLIPPQ